MLKNNETKILLLLKIGPLFIILISIVIFYIIYNNNNKILEYEIQQIEKRSFLEKKAMIKREVESVYDYISDDLKQAKSRIKKDIKNRVYEAYSIANSIYENNQDKDPKVIKKLIFDALRDIKFNEGRGYFFIYTLDGTALMHPVLPQIVGKNLRSFQDTKGNFSVLDTIKMLKEKGEGFNTFWWIKPSNKEQDFEKIGFVKTFEPYNWYIGTGEYVVDYEDVRKKELLEKIQNIRFGKNGYIFIFDENGETLSHVKKDLIGKNRIDLQDKNGVYLVKKIIDVGKKGADYISYIGTIQPTTGKPAQKVSYVKGYEKWGWSIGAGVYINDLNEIVNEKNNLILENYNSQFQKILLINVIIFGTLFIISLYLSRMTKNLFLAHNKIAKKKNRELEKLNNTLEDKVEERTKEQNSLLSLFEEGDSVLFRWNNDENWTVDYVSSNVSNLVGYTKEEFDNGLISYADCVYKDDLQQIIDEDKHRKKEGKAFFRHSPYRIVTKDGTIKWILEYNLVVRDKDTKITHLLGYILDDTSNQKAKKELEIAKKQALEANDAKSEFLANMSHEIRTPMNGIIGMTTLALSRIDKDVVQAKDFTKKANNSAKMLLGIINDILDFSKIEAGKLDIENKQVSLGEILSQMNDLFSYTASQKDIKFIIEYDKMVPEYILGDKLRLTQVLTNLISNAVKFTQKGTIKLKLELLTKDKNNIQLKFSVKDTGKGILKENQHKLFQSFSQEDNSISREYGGTGLGLTISKNLVELMGGEIGFESEENEGSTFFFTLNTHFLEEESITKKESKIISNHEDEIMDVSILVVEDNDINQEIAYNFLSQIVKKVDLASNGKEALDILDSKPNNHYKLILMDIHMPVLDGNNATIKIKEQNKYKDLPIVAMTANVLQKEIEYSFKCGMSDYITKPFEVKELFDKVKYWVNKKEKVKIITIKEEIQYSDKVLDTQDALEKMLDRKDLYKNFLEKYIKTRKNSFNDIVKLIEENDLKEAISKLHSLRGILLTMGAKRLSNMLFKMEESLKRTEEINETLINDAKDEMVLVFEEINKWLNQNQQI